MAAKTVLIRVNKDRIKLFIIISGSISPLAQSHHIDEPGKRSGEPVCITPS